MASKNTPANRQPNQPQLTPEHIDRLLAIQEADLAERSRENNIRELEIQKTHEFSTDAIKLQAEDRKDSRESKRKDNTRIGIFAVVLLLIVVGFLVYCLQTGNQDIAIKIITYGGTALVAGVSGYFYGNSKKDKPENNKE